MEVKFLIFQVNGLKDLPGCRFLIPDSDAGVRSATRSKAGANEVTVVIEGEGFEDATDGSSNSSVKVAGRVSASQAHKQFWRIFMHLRLGQCCRNPDPEGAEDEESVL